MFDLCVRCGVERTIDRYRREIAMWAQLPRVLGELAAEYFAFDESDCIPPDFGFRGWDRVALDQTRLHEQLWCVRVGVREHRGVTIIYYDTGRAMYLSARGALHLTIRNGDDLQRLCVLCEINPYKNVDPFAADRTARDVAWYDKSVMVPSPHEQPDACAVM
jgi:hypothetical protein